MNNFFSVTTIARHVISVTLLTGAATAMVAGSASPADSTTQRADQATSIVRNEHGDNEELRGLIKTCIESHDKISEACQKAIAAKKDQPKHETKKPETPAANADVEALVKECIERYMNASKTGEGGSDAKEVCLRAIAASGLTPEEFYRKFLQHEKKHEPTSESRGELVKACVNLAAELKGDSSREDVEKTAAICAKAKSIFDH
jgi:hypothetical protein